MHPFPEFVQILKMDISDTPLHHFQGGYRHTPERSQWPVSAQPPILDQSFVMIHHGLRIPVLEARDDCVSRLSYHISPPFSRYGKIVIVSFCDHCLNSIDLANWNTFSVDSSVQSKFTTPKLTREMSRFFQFLFFTIPSGIRSDQMNWLLSFLSGRSFCPGYASR